MSDTFCRLATGGGHAVRSLYTNDEETFFTVQRPVILTGITDFITQSDMIDRCLFIHCLEIKDDKREQERVFWKRFDKVHSLILGSLYDVVANGMQSLRKVKLARVSRMADFVYWGEAVGRTLGLDDGQFITIYEKNRDAAFETILDESPIVEPIRNLARCETWEGTAGQLLETICSMVGESATRGIHWPKSPRGLSATLRRLAPILRKNEKINVEFGDRTWDKRPITISFREGPTETAKPTVTNLEVVSAFSGVSFEGNDG
jgi:hypothetical protein